jgi:hypothetical protein
MNNVILVLQVMKHDLLLSSSEYVIAINYNCKG